MSATDLKPIRAAIYTRKSSDDGLDQKFNSLDAQRESGEAYIASQKGTGLVCLPDRYDDGGYSGGNMERPGLKRLLADIEAGRIDAVVAYKIDRLTRSIRHFGLIMEQFEKHGVTLMVVTQPIQTNTSMGRLMVHVLMSFAEFERELASERTRDKIALSRQRGQWTGGRPVLGFDVVDTRLVVNRTEATVVRAIFDLYLEHRSFGKVLALLEARGIKNKAWVAKAGAQMGGHPFTKSRLSQMLSNPLYIGRVPHRDKTYAGQHSAIIDASVFERVQLLLAENARSGASLTRNRHGGLLKGVLRCGCCGASMVHSSTGKANGVTYRYYVCMSRQAMGRKRCKGATVPAEQIEQFVVGKIRSSFDDPGFVSLVLDVSRSRIEGSIRDLEARVQLTQGQIADSGLCPNAESTLDDVVGSEDLQSRLRKLNAEIAELRESLVDRAIVERGLHSFDPIWSSLSLTERAQVLALVVERVDFDGDGGQVAIKLHDERAQAGAGSLLSMGAAK